ncbi:phage minor head protein [Conservatibacter flavescens]|uniref:Phage head morphogenesis protein n=1 Tax=Conservatibacter flavescens TaxID=28161 RepID=A0A2M8S4Z0_9PAST|nr:phage minor head protein [Conservatibacter flavescens]PJG86207.1 phage head morphogenesis protein [Conservatibacter flavescens]
MPNAPKFAIGIEPTQAIEYLKQKRMLASKVFAQELQASSLARATTIAKLSSLEMTKDIYASMEKAMREGKAFNQWKKELVGEFERKGWVFGHDKAVSRGIDGKLLADPKTGEYFGTPRRLNMIYRTNMQQAYSAARYQRMMDNVDNRPYWQYSAVGDSRTRPAHMEMNGKIYRYDDPFWATFYPPNGFNCRCTVIALDKRDLARRGIDEVGDSSARLVEVERVDKKGNREKTMGFKAIDGSVRVTDKGFDYNIGRLIYRPNLDLYPEKLAHQFAKTEMAGGEFRFNYEQLEKAYLTEKAKLGIDKKITNKELLQKVELSISKNFKFATGILNNKDKQLINSHTATVWLSDESLIKQFNSRLDDSYFSIDSYQEIPDVLNGADSIFKNGNTYIFVKSFDEFKNYTVFVKHIKNTNELFMVSARLQNKIEWDIERQKRKYEAIR